MSSQRERVLSKGEIATEYGIARNEVFRAFDTAFRHMFQEYDGSSDEDRSHQRTWYVGQRWDRRTRKFVPQGEEPEVRLLHFVNEDVAAGGRTLRIIYGRTGAGKTTFLKHFFQTYLPEEHPDLYKTLAPIMIDCAESAVSADLLEPDVDRRVHECLKRKYPWLEDESHFLRMWESECDFDKLFYIRLWTDVPPAATLKQKLKIIEPRRRDHHDFNRVRINYLIQLGYRPVLIWDNIDHAPLDVQQRAIQLARHKLSWMHGAKVIIAIREYTYPLVQQEIAPAAYQISDQEIHAPNVHEVLRRRADSVVAHLGEPNVEVQLTERFSFILARPRDFLQTVLDSLKQRPVEKALCDLAAENVRIQLKMVDRTLRSGHIPIEMIASMVQSYSSGGKPVRLSWRRFVEGLICGDYRFYKEEGEDQALVVNVFESGDLTHPFCNSLCMPRLLQMVDSVAFDIDLAEVVRALEVVGYPGLALRTSANNLLKANLIHSPQGRMPSEFLEGGQPEIPYYVTCTSAGRYYVRRLMRELVYVQHMSAVTSMEERFRQEVRLWMPGELEAGVRSAAALIAQVYGDETRELKAALRTRVGTEIHRQYGFGRLAHDMTRTCHKALDLIRKAWHEEEEGGAVDWSALKRLLEARAILAPQGA